MNLKKTVTEDGRIVKIIIGRRFDFDVHRQFRDSYESVGPKAQEYIIDLAKTEYMDSSALGMLLILRDYAGGDNAIVKIINCSVDVNKTLAVSNFSSLFAID